MAKRKTIKRPSDSNLARRYGYGIARPNYSLMSEWRESDNQKLNKRYDALSIGYLMQEHGYNLKSILVKANEGTL